MKKETSLAIFPIFKKKICEEQTLGQKKIGFFLNSTCTNYEPKIIEIREVKVQKYYFIGWFGMEWPNMNLGQFLKSIISTVKDLFMHMLFWTFLLIFS